MSSAQQQWAMLAYIGEFEEIRVSQGLTLESPDVLCTAPHEDLRWNLHSPVCPFLPSFFSPSLFPFLSSILAACRASAR